MVHLQTSMSQYNNGRWTIGKTFTLAVKSVIQQWKIKNVRMEMIVSSKALSNVRESSGKDRQTKGKTIMEVEKKAEFFFFSEVVNL